MLRVSTNESIVLVVVAQFPMENHAVSSGRLLDGGCRGERPRGSYRHGVSSLSAVLLGAGEFTGGAQRLTVGFPVLLQLWQPCHQEVRERRHLQQHGLPLGRGIG
jgi:hypothetical protein